MNCLRCEVEIIWIRRARPLASGYSGTCLGGGKRWLCHSCRTEYLSQITEMIDWLGWYTEPKWLSS